jgi:hypothetical protein
VTGAAGSAITIEGFLEEQLAPFSHQRITRGCRLGRCTSQKRDKRDEPQKRDKPVPLGVSG